MSGGHRSRYYLEPGDQAAHPELSPGVIPHQPGLGSSLPTSGPLRLAQSPSLAVVLASNGFSGLLGLGRGTVRLFNVTNFLQLDIFLLQMFES